MTQIEITKLSYDKLVREIFYFILEDVYIIFFMYEHQVRERRQRHFTTDKAWSPELTHSIPLEEVPITDEIRQQALNACVLKLRIRTSGVDAWKTGTLRYISFSDKDLEAMEKDKDGRPSGWNAMGIRRKR